MKMNRIIFPTPESIRAARGFLNWTQENLSQRCGVSSVSIIAIENGRQEASQKTLNAIATAFENEGIVFNTKNGIEFDSKVVQILEGKEGRLSYMNDIYNTLKDTGGEALYHSAHSKRAVKANDKHFEEIAEIKKKMKDAGIKTRFLVKEGDTHIMEPLENFRWIDPADMIKDNMLVIYADKIAFCFYSKDTSPAVFKVITLRNKEFANYQRKAFNKLWDTGKKIPYSTAEKKW